MTTNRMKNIVTVAVLTSSAVIAFSALAENDRRIQLINDSSKTIMEFYASNIDRRVWEKDILGRMSLPPGYSSIINLDDGSGYCKFDFKTVMETGEEIVKWRVNVCELSSYRVYD